MVTKKKKPAHKGKSKQSPKHVYAVSVTCACNRDITQNELEQIYSAQSSARVKLFLPEINSTLTKYSITSCLKKSHFLAQVGHESGQLTYVAEVLPKGHTEEKDYGGYKGRGLIQLTHEDKYEEYGDAVNHDFLAARKTDLEQTKWATDSAGWFWTSGSDHDLNDVAGKNDFIRITELINGGYNGYNDRHGQLKRAAKILRLDIRPNQSKPVNVTTYVFEDSDSYNSTEYKCGGSFAWGYWHDAASTRTGVTKDAAQAKLGYEQFLALANGLPKKNKPKKGRFGFDTFQKMIDHATSRVAAVNKPK